MYFAKRKGEELYDWYGHTLDVAACMQVFLALHHRLRAGLTNLLGCSDELLTQWLTWAAVRHDLGKPTTAFQRMLVEGANANYGRSGAPRVV